MITIFSRANSKLTADNREHLERTLHARPRRIRPEQTWIQPLRDRSCLFFPFHETLVKTFLSETGFGTARVQKGSNGIYYVILDPQELSIGKNWIDSLTPYVAIRDCLHTSFALDFNKAQGHFSQEPTAVGILVTRSKSYHGERKPSRETSIPQIVSKCVSFIRSRTLYANADSILAVVSSRKRNRHSLPGSVARSVASELAKEDLSARAALVKSRKLAKNVAMMQKINVLDGTIRIKPSAVRGKRIILLDDFYQSGATMNHQGLVLLQLGAAEVYGLSLLKTCGDKDNVSWKD